MSVIIGINADVIQDEKPRQSLYLDYIDWVIDAGAVPLVLPAHESVLSALDRVDGVLFVGGDDYEAGNTNGVPRDFEAVAPRREAFDFRLAREVLRRDLPLLAVCGGFQLIALAGGGTIYGDLPSERPSDVRHRRVDPEQPLDRHPVEWEAGVRTAILGESISDGSYETNSHHHQAVRDLPEEWSPVATAPDGVLEAACGPGRFQLGIQWHPEKDRHDSLSRHIMDAFVRSAGAGRR